MTLPTIVPTEYDGTDNDFLKTKGVDRSGAVRMINGAVTVPTATVADTIIGLVPFNKGAKFSLNDKTFHVGNIGAGTTVVNVGFVYDDAALTDDPNAFVSASTAAQSGDFIAIDEIAGYTFEAEGNGWLVIQPATANTDAEGDVSFSVLQTYGG